MVGEMQDFLTSPAEPLPFTEDEAKQVKRPLGDFINAEVKKKKRMEDNHDR